MDFKSIESEILGFVRGSYPKMKVAVQAWTEDPSRLAVYFVEEEFASLYPLQRYHYLGHLIPVDYQKQRLANSVWFELAPGEKPADLRYPDEEVIASITPHVMKCLHTAKFFLALDDLLCPAITSQKPVLCHGDYRHSKHILLARHCADDEFFDIFHVLMAQGGFCDCEILYNIARESRLGKEYWRARAEGRKSYDPHQGT